MKNRMTVEAATYIVTHHFSAESNKKQDLLLDLLCQKLVVGSLDIPTPY
jgi:hypothetical protein